MEECSMQTPFFGGLYPGFSVPTSAMLPRDSMSDDAYRSFTISCWGRTLYVLKRT